MANSIFSGSRNDRTRIKAHSCPFLTIRARSCYITKPFGNTAPFLTTTMPSFTVYNE